MLHGTEKMLRVGHHDVEAAVERARPADSANETVGIFRIAFGDSAAIGYETQGQSRAKKVFLSITKLVVFFLTIFNMCDFVPLL
jgi:hypothetical protein